MLFSVYLPTPLEQFEVYRLLCRLNTNIDWIFIYFLGFFFFLIGIFFFFDWLVPSYVVSILSKIFFFVYNIFKENLGIAHIFFFPLLFFFFSFFFLLLFLVFFFLYLYLQVIFVFIFWLLF